MQYTMFVYIDAESDEEALAFGMATVFPEQPIHWDIQGED